MERYTQAEVARRLKIRPNTLKQWLLRGLVKPSEPAQGTGTRNLFTRDDCYRITLFQELAATGFVLKKASDLANDLSFTGLDEKHRFFVVYLECKEVHGDRVFSLGYRGLKKGIPAAPPHGYHGVIGVDLLKVKEDVDDRLDL